MNSEASTPFVSVVVPCYNSLKTVRDCLESLFHQSYSPDRFEVILVDNGSGDGTVQFVQTNFPSVTLLSCSVKGSGYVRNVGIEAARGEFILSTDSDCVCDPEWITHLVRALSSAPPAVAAIGGKILPYSTRTPVERFEPIWVSQPDARTRAAGVSYAATTNAIFRASVLKELHGFDGTAGHDDSDLGLRMAAAGYQVQFCDEAIVRHRNPITLKELYEHRVKYGERNFILSRRHPEVLGDPGVGGAHRNLVLATARRVAGDILVKLPLTLIAGSGERPRIWPLIDATSALGNLKGFQKAARAEARLKAKR